MNFALVNPEVAHQYTVLSLQKAIIKLDTCIQNLQEVQQLNPNNVRFGQMISTIRDEREKIQAELTAIQTAHASDNNITANHLDPGFQ